jgi:hypothetical protein
MRGPLATVLVGSEHLIAGLKAKQIAVVQVPDMDDPCLCCERSVVTQFAGRPVSRAVDFSHFSAAELVWATM